MRTQNLFDRYYFSKPSYVGGTQLFHDLCKSHYLLGEPILEVGSGPANSTTAFLSGLGDVTGLDVSDEIHGNPYLAKALVYQGRRMPLPDSYFGMCVSNYVLEHLEEPGFHFLEVFRILKPGGVYCFRTPNLLHYVSLGSRVLPHSLHLRLANRLRGLEEGAHDPWPTVYRANTRSTLSQLAEDAGLFVTKLRMVEAEPTYGSAHWLLFYPMMAYERVVNRYALLGTFRANIFGTLGKRP